MQGHAYRCDSCGRIAFVPEQAADEQGLYVPPPGWLGVSQVPLEGEDWEDTMYHFCTWICLADHSNKMVTEPEPDVEPASEAVA